MWINLESLGWIIYDLKFIRAEISRLIIVLPELRLVDDARAIWFYLLDDCVAFIWTIEIMILKLFQVHKLQFNCTHYVLCNYTITILIRNINLAWNQDSLSFQKQSWNKNSRFQLQCDSYNEIYIFFLNGWYQSTLVKLYIWLKIILNSRLKLNDGKVNEILITFSKLHSIVK